MLSELARLGARLIIQRPVQEEFDSWLGRRYERRPDGPPGKRNGFRPRHVQTAEGELRIEIPQVRETAEPFVSKLFRKGHTKRLLRTDPLKAMIVGAFVRGLSVRGVESLCEEAGLGKTSKSTVARTCSELHERFEAFCRRDLYETRLSVLFLDAIYQPVRPSGPAGSPAKMLSRPNPAIRRAIAARGSASSSPAFQRRYDSLAGITTSSPGRSTVLVLAAHDAHDAVAHADERVEPAVRAHGARGPSGCSTISVAYSGVMG